MPSEMAVQMSLGLFRESFLCDQYNMAFDKKQFIKDKQTQFREAYTFGGKTGIVALNTDNATQIEYFITNSLSQAITEAEQDFIEKYGDFREVSRGNVVGRTVRFYMLPHTQHTEEEAR